MRQASAGFCIDSPQAGELFILPLVALLGMVSAPAIASVDFTGDSDAVARGYVGPSIDQVHFPFIANEGQIDANVLFYAPTLQGTIFITDSGDIVYSLPGSIAESGRPGCVALREVFLGSENSGVEGSAQSSTRVSDFRNGDPTHWRTGIATFDRVCLGELYDGVSGEVRARGSNVEKILTVAPGADPGRIRVRLSGAEALSVADTGELEVETALGRVSFTKPVAYQEIAGARCRVDVAYCVSGDEYGFLVGDYDTSRTLTIDPLLASTFLGTSDCDGFYQVPSAIDGDGNIYVASRTSSTDFPITPGAYDSTFNDRAVDGFVAKLNGDLTTLLAATFLGGTGREGGWPGFALALDGDGNVFVAGATRSSDFPTTASAYDTSYNGEWDVFVSKLNGDLSQLVASTYLGGVGDDDSPSLATDTAGNVYVTGLTTSTADFPYTSGAYDSVFNGGPNDTFVSKLNGDLSQLVGSTFLGGNNYDAPEAICVDEEANVYVTGWTSSLNFPTHVGAYRAHYCGGMYDLFVSRFSSDLTALPYSSFVGGTDWDFGYGMTLDGNGNVYVTGHTASPDFPYSPGAHDTTYNGSGGASVGDDTFVTKLNGTLSAMLASTYLGGSLWENGTALAVDGNGNVYVGGSTNSTDFPTPEGAYDGDYDGSPNGNAGDIFVSRLDGDLTTLSASTYLGGAGAEVLGSMNIGPDGNVCLAGGTSSTDFPYTPGAYDTSFNGGVCVYDNRVWGGDVVVVKLDSLLSASLMAVGDGIDVHRTVPLSNHPNPFNPMTTIAFSVARTSPVTLEIYDVNGRLVRTLIRRTLDAGSHSTVWNATDSKGKAVGSGLYFSRLETREGVEIRKMLLLK